MKHLKLFESFDNDNKYKSVNSLFIEFCIYNFMVEKNVYIYNLQGFDYYGFDPYFGLLGKSVHHGSFVRRAEIFKRFIWGSFVEKLCDDMLKGAFQNAIVSALGKYKRYAVNKKLYISWNI